MFAFIFLSEAGSFPGKSTFIVWICDL